MAERGGFEPPVTFLPRTLSKRVLSTTQPSLLLKIPCHFSKETICITVYNLNFMETFYRYSESGQLNALYNEYCQEDPETVKEKMELWQGSCKEVIDSGDLDIHEYNALYELYKEMLIWRMMIRSELIDISKYFTRDEAEEGIREHVARYIENVYGGKDGLEEKGIEKATVAMLGTWTPYAPDIMREAFWDARVDMVRWQVAEKLEEYGHMN